MLCSGIVSVLLYTQHVSIADCSIRVHCFEGCTICFDSFHAAAVVKQTIRGEVEILVKKYHVSDTLFTWPYAT